MTSKKKTAAMEMLGPFLMLYRHASEEDQDRAWAVLTALRGPDIGCNDAEDIKDATTCVIRRAVFGDLRVPGYSHPDSEARAALRRRWGEDYGTPWAHFRAHVREAFRALRLDWGEVNRLS